MHYFVKTLFTSFFLFFLLVLVLTKVDFSSPFTAHAELATPSATINKDNSATSSASSSAKVDQATNDSDLMADEKSLRDEEIEVKSHLERAYYPDRLIVKFKNGVSDEVKKQIVRANKAKFVKEPIGIVGAKVIMIEEALLDKTMESFKNDPNVEYVEKDGVIKITSLPSDCYPNDPAYCSGKQWGLDAIYAPGGWKFNTGSSSVAVAVIDTGVDYNHLDLRDKVIKGNNYMVSSNVPAFSDPMDDNGHGTFIAGTIGAETNNNSNVAGVNWGAKILAIKAAGQTGLFPPYALIKAVRSAANDYPQLNVKVISLSMSTEIDYPDFRNEIQNAQNKGIIVVAGTAHTGDASTDCFIGFPAAYTGVVSVAGVNENGQHASGCTQTQLNGTTYQSVQMSAPGINLYGLQLGGGSGFHNPPNTSFATPFVSGVASILASCSPSPTLDLFLGANDLGPVGYDSTNGYGEVNLYKSLLFNCAPPNSLKGDVDCNGIVNADDALHILKYVAGMEPGGNNCQANYVFLPKGDVNGDFVVDSVDALYILQIVSGMRNAQTQSLVAPAVDSDGDGMTDQQEAAYPCLNPKVADANLDPDGDKLTNIQEIVLGTNPCVADSDGDGFSDYTEFYVGTNPLVKCGVDAWPPDINNDNKVTIQDVGKFIPVLNSVKGDSRYNRRFDLNADGKITTQDVGKFIPYLNTTCSL